ncbi:MAG: sigma-54-dependent Fis family transcriptional regulator [Planctomycetota bacterium]|jgi:Nif-specific regulatory protein
MAQLEIRDRQDRRSLVELGAEPVPVGFDGEGRAAWGTGRVTRQVAEVAGDRLRVGTDERRLIPGEPVEVAGLRLTYRGARDVRTAAFDEIDHLWTVSSAEEVYPRVLDAVLQVLRVHRAAIALLDDDDLLRVHVARGTGLRLNPTVTRAVLDSGTAILTSEASEQDDAAEGVAIDVRAVLCVPLRYAGRTQGVLYLDNQGRDGAFTNDELDFTSALAHLASYALDNLNETQALREENILLKRQLGLGGGTVHASSAMEEVLAKAERVAGFDATVLITGESGVGKEMVAREIHARSPRRQGLFVAVNCAAIPETLLESELFGYAPHSGISGADPKGRAGKFERADGGTIFLDEIGELKQELQAKLLRVLEDKKVDRINDTVSRDVDVRIIVATNQDLAQLVAAGRFRDDLFYRLNVVALEVPPLRRRREDIPVLAEFFVRSYAGPEPLRQAKLSKAAARALATHDWPGNVRELKNCIEQALILGDGKTIRLGDLPPPVRRRTTDERDLPPLVDVEKEHIARVLHATGWNKAKSARILGISKPTLYEKIKNYGLTRE